MKCAADYRRMARESLNGKWKKAALAFLLVTLLGGGFLTSGLSIEISAEDMQYALRNAQVSIHQVPISVSPEMLLVILFFMLLFAGLGPAARLGYNRFTLNLIDGREIRASQVLSGYAWFWKALWLTLLISLKITGWMLLMMIPAILLAILLQRIGNVLLVIALFPIMFIGIYIAYGYSLSYYVLAEHPEQKASEAISESVRLMHQNRWRLFCLEISFIGWELLSALTMGILGIVYVGPYTQTALAHFYRDLAGAPSEEIPASDNAAPWEQNDRT